VFTGLNHANPVDEDRVDTGGILDRRLIRRPIGNGRRIEEDQIGDAAGLEAPPVNEA
jgi:hypothetical protein